MRLAIPSTFPPFRGGISQFNEALKSALEEKGHEVIVVNWSRQYPRMLFPGKDQFDPELDSPYTCALDSIRPSTWRKVGTELAGLHLDAVVIPFWHAALAPALTGVIRALKKKSGAAAPKIIGLTHNAGSHDAAWWDAALTKKFLFSLDDAWTLSQEITDRLQELRDDLPVNTLFHPLYDHFPALIPVKEAKEKLHLPAEALVILYFGLIRPYKGLDQLIRAFDALNDINERPVHLLIAGECYGKWKPYQVLIEKSKHSGRIQTHERFISDREVGLFFGAADVVALPYRRASQSGVTAVALHYGKPIVATRVGGLAEYILPGETGELAQVNDVENLADCLARCLRSSYNESSFEKAREKFSWSTFIDKALG